jgi:hypothetical protein
MLARQPVSPVAQAAAPKQQPSPILMSTPSGLIVPSCLFHMCVFHFECILTQVCTIWRRLDATNRGRRPVRSGRCCESSASRCPKCKFCRYTNAPAVPRCNLLFVWCYIREVMVLFLAIFVIIIVRFGEIGVIFLLWLFEDWNTTQNTGICFACKRRHSSNIKSKWQNVMILLFRLKLREHDRSELQHCQQQQE